MDRQQSTKNLKRLQGAASNAWNGGVRIATAEWW